jgi:hypothetical protein
MREGPILSRRLQKMSARMKKHHKRMVVAKNPILAWGFEV